MEPLISTIKEVEEKENLYLSISKLKQQIKDYEEILRYYSQMTAVCEHDDSSWCEFCPDAGRRATKVLKKYG